MVPLPASIRRVLMSCSSVVSELRVFSSMLRLLLATSRLSAKRLFSDCDWLMLIACAAARGSSAGVTMRWPLRSEEHTSELQSLMRISYAVFCLKKKKNNKGNSKCTYTHKREQRIYANEKDKEDRPN